MIPKELKALQPRRHINIGFEPADRGAKLVIGHHAYMLTPELGYKLIDELADILESRS